VRALRPAGSDPRFLVKALSEASGELRELLESVPRSQLHRRGAPPDEDWTLATLAYHLCEVEEGVGRQLGVLLTAREPVIPHVDLDDIPDPELAREVDATELVERFGWTRRRTTYVLWDLDDRDWQRAGIHPYRGRVTVADLARELYQHDLEHLWQARRMTESLASARP
jgi:hypothetical protein